MTPTTLGRVTPETVHATLGRVMLVMAAGLVAAGSYAIKRVVTIKV